MNELEALAKEWIKHRDKFRLGDNDAIFRIVEIEEKLKNNYNIAKPIEWLLAEERKLIQHEVGSLRVDMGNPG